MRWLLDTGTAGLTISVLPGRRYEILFLVCNSQYRRIVDRACTGDTAFEASFEPESSGQSSDDEQNLVDEIMAQAVLHSDLDGEVPE